MGEATDEVFYWEKKSMKYGGWPRHWKFLKEMWKTVITTWVETANKWLLFYFEKLNFLLNQTYPVFLPVEILLEFWSLLKSKLGRKQNKKIIEVGSRLCIWILSYFLPVLEFGVNYLNLKESIK